MAENLTSDERESLREVAKDSLMKLRIPDDHARKLMDLGLIEQKLGGLVATPKGKIEAQKRR